MTITDTQKAPWLSVLHTLPTSSEDWQPPPIGKMWLPRNVAKGITGEREKTAKVRVTEHRITHRWFSAAPPLGSALPLERGPRCSSSPSRNSAASLARSAGSPSISSRCWKWFLPGGETETINRREALGKEEWAYSQQPFWWIQLCWRALKTNPSFPSSSSPFWMQNTRTCPPTMSFSSFLTHWEKASSRKLLSQINQRFLQGFIPMQDHEGLHAKIHSEHRAVDFWELGMEMHVIAKEVNIW